MAEIEINSGDKTSPGQAAAMPAAAGGFEFPRARLRQFYYYAAAVSLCFSPALYWLVRYALHNDFFSYIPLVPVITIYLICTEKNRLPKEAGRSIPGAATMALAGAAVLIGWVAILHSGVKPGKNDFLTATTAAYLFFIVAGAFFCLGGKFVRAAVFPISLLIFMVPIPSAALDSIEMFFQVTSAMMATVFVDITGMPVYRTFTTLHLPGYSVVVDKECSGIHSTMVLLITSLLAGHLFLRSKWRRWVLVLFVIPLAVARNGFRIAVIGELCVRISHDMIESPIHRHGGPLFFALSLVPFFLLLLWLRKNELRGVRAAGGSGKS